MHRSGLQSRVQKFISSQVTCDFEVVVHKLRKMSPRWVMFICHGLTDLNWVYGRWQIERTVSSTWTPKGMTCADSLEIVRRSFSWTFWWSVRPASMRPLGKGMTLNCSLMALGHFPCWLRVSGNQSPGHKYHGLHMFNRGRDARR